MMEWLRTWFAPGPIFLWACPALLLLIPIVWLRSRSTKRPRVMYSSAMLTLGIGNSWVIRTRWILPLLRSLAIIAFIIALARPQSGGEYRDSSEGIAIQMVLDKSGSMATDDFMVNGHQVRRIDAVKKVFEDFVLGKGKLQGREGDLVGLTTFAMLADTPCPLTLDHGGLIDLARQTDIPGWVDGRQVRQSQEAGYTALGDAIALATDVLRRAGEQAQIGVPGAEAAKSRVMILLTDGADNPPPIPNSEPIKPVEAAKVAATLGIKIYTIGAAGDVPSSQQRGLFAMARMGFDPGAEVLLKEVAATTGGKYFRATDGNSLTKIYDEIDRLERRKTGEREFHDNVAASRTAMLAGLGLLFGELMLANTRYRRIP
ncbi:MAG: VWA domain-containing protein [Planctomycetes bacterium]|nr:VWA domain-containing protein [Planctomycetota bacterium]MBI3833697.1 VWA domain-containing protein [Planctomycetota bacterium]